MCFLIMDEEEEGESGRSIIDFPQGLLFAFLKKFNQRFSFLLGNELAVRGALPLREI
jgi:hypothetical protein